MIEKSFINIVLVRGLEKLFKAKFLDDELVSLNYQRIKRILNKMELVGEERRKRIWNSDNIEKTLKEYGFKTEEIVYLIAKRSVELVYMQLLKSDMIENSSVIIAIEYAIKIIELEERAGIISHTDPILEALKASK